MISRRGRSDVASRAGRLFGDNPDGGETLHILGAWSRNIGRGRKVPSPDGGVRWWLAYGGLRCGRVVKEGLCP